MAPWLQGVFAIVVIASLFFIVTGAVAIVKTRGSLLRPWLLLAVGLITLMNVYLITAPVAPLGAQGEPAPPKGTLQ
jgi:hypothetical protein